MSEKTQYKTFKDKVIEPTDRCDRVENVLLNGMPDISLCINGVEIWIELKQPTEPKRETTKLFSNNHKISLEQRNWHLSQKNAGGKCFFLIETCNFWFLVDGIDAELINDCTVNELKILSKVYMDKPVRDQYKWKLLRAALLN